MSNLVFLDSRDLIDCVEHHTPCGPSRLGKDLAKRDLSLVLAFSNLLEIIPRGTPLSYAHEFAKRLERIPHVFVPHTHISSLEFNEAVTAFAEGREPRHVLPTFTNYAIYVCTFAPGDPPPAGWVEQVGRIPLSEHVCQLLHDGQSLELDPQGHHRAAMQQVLDQNRAVLGAKRTNKSVLAEMVESQLHELNLKVDDLKAFSGWLYRDPSICPGWRLLQEVFQEFRTDTSAAVSTGDMPDLTHIYLVPYVRAATLDRKWREYTRRATDRLVKSGLRVSYSVFRNLSEVRSAVARAANNGR